jgi:hypothetical protein
MRTIASLAADLLHRQHLDLGYRLVIADRHQAAIR